MTRALVLAGGGLRVAWQAGVVRALDEAGLTFAHGDGTSGGIFSLGMLLSGVSPVEMGERWRTLDPKRSVSLLPWRRYLGSPTDLPAFGDADGLVEQVFPHLGIDVDAIRRSTGMTGTFNVADFTTKTCVAVPHDEIDLPRLTAGVSLPVFLPAVEAGGTTWTDAVWIKDANLLEAVHRGCNELWVAWCIGNTPRWGRGAMEQYVHMIELSANGALFAELAEIAAINERRRAGEAVHGSTEPIVVHVVKPHFPLPLDPDFMAGRITAETLVAMGYRDARAYLEALPPEGVELGPRATAMEEPPLGARFTVRGEGRLGVDRVEVHLVGEVTDLEGFAAGAGAGHHPRRLAASSQVGTGAAGGRTLPGRVLARRGAALRRGRPPGHARRPAGAAGHVRAAGRASDSPPCGPAASTWPSRSPTAAPSPGDGLRLSPGDLVRLALSFEPSGAHNLADRWSALRQTARFLHRR